ncbi:MAG: M4 family metallopeptidase [Nocardioides sp.]
MSQVACLALLGAALVAVPAARATTDDPRPAHRDDVVQRLRAEAQGRVAVSTERGGDRLDLVRATRGGDLLPGRSGDSRAEAAAKAVAWLDEYGAAFGADPDQLLETGVRSGGDGWTVTFTQQHRGLPVFGSMLKANFDRGGDLTAVTGYAVPDLRLGVEPGLSAAQAAARAVAVVAADPPGDERTDAAGPEAVANDLVVYETGAIRGEPGPAILAYVVEVTDGAAVRDLVFLDAVTGKPVNRYSLVHDDLQRRLYEGSPRSEDLVWAEGDGLPGSLSAEQQSLVESTGETYWLFRNAFGRDSYDAAGAAMRVVNNAAISCPNANWNGVTTNFCDGVTSDDTVAHEWAHAYTEHTSGLIYQWQPGALNESFSDIWGETVDLVNGRQDQEDDTLRPVGRCSKHTGSQVELTVEVPASLAGPCETAPAAFGPAFDETGITGDLVVGRDLDRGADDTSTDGCDPFANAAALEGSFVYVDRGGCSFDRKADRASAAGARAIVVGNDVAGAAPFAMPGSSDLPGVMIGRADGGRIKSATETVTVTIRETAVDSHRWLSGEGDAGFGGAIRDLWSPTCYGDPGKVSDAEYRCYEADSGGVHSNSGVPNHAFSLLVDGGTYNGVDVPGIGLDRAAHVYWRAQTAYLTPTSDFADLADALDSACLDLVGDPITAMSTAADDPGRTAPSLTTDDCTAVSRASTAVELRREPTECRFRPVLRSTAPGTCGRGFRTVTVWRERFGDGLQGWDRSGSVVFRNGRGFAWRASTRAPQHGNDPAAFAPDPDTGTCAGGRGDVSSVNRLASRTVRMPTRRFASSRLTLRHYVATEAGYDGGNLKIRVNGRRWRGIPASAFRFNPYNTRLAGRATNTSPLAGQRAFSGTDGGSVRGSWGTSIVNLGAMDVGRGDRVRIRFDMGRDGCAGKDGWYVDDVVIAVCRPLAVRLR